MTIKYSTFIQASADYLQERTLSFGGQSNPQGQVVILAGGGGSGKGYIKEFGINIDAKSIDVDELKNMIMRSPKIMREIEDETGIDVSKARLSNPADVAMLHAAVDKMGWVDARQKLLFKSVALEKNKPNLMFDVTAKTIDKLEKIATTAIAAGYNKTDINVVWVCNKLTTAIQQNSGRARVVPEDILIKTHEGASLTMATLFDSMEQYRSLIDGMVAIVFNQFGVDNLQAFTKREKDTVKELERRRKEGEQGGRVILVSSKVILKDAGQPLNQTRVTDEIMQKIKEYVPNPGAWN